MKDRKYPFLKSIALIVTVTFSVTSIYFPSAPAFADTGRALESANLLPIKDLKLSSDLGEIEDRYVGESKSPVILIRDAHSIADAQKNIEQILYLLIARYGVNFIGVEGATAKLDTEIFQKFPDQKKLREVIQGFADKGELGGSAIRAVLAGSPDAEEAYKDRMRAATFYGVEDWELYEEGIALYLKALDQQSEILRKVEDQEKEIAAKKQKNYSSELLKLDQTLQSFYLNQANILEALKTFASVKAPQAGSELAILLAESKNEGKSDISSDVEVKKLARKLELTLRKKSSDPKVAASLRRLHEEQQKFQTSQISAQAFALTLKEIARQEKLKLSLSSELRGKVREQKKLRDLEGSQLMNHFETYTENVMTDLIRQNPSNQALFSELQAKTKQLRMIEKLARLELSREDWQKVKSLEPSRLSLETGDERSATKLTFDAHLEFYRNSEAREEAMLRNLVARGLGQWASSQSLATSGERPVPSILVAGGFHTEGLAAALRAQKISYVLIRPAMKSIPEHSLYQEHMRGQVSWSDYFEVENGTLDLYKAFVRAVRDQLLRSPGTSRQGLENEKRTPDPRPQTLDPTLLKSWRDEIIRDLSDKKEIEKAGEYTRFIDEVVSEKDKSISDDRFAKLEKFIQKLTKLDASGQMNETNFIKLFSPSNLPDGPSVPLGLGRHHARNTSSGVRLTGQLREPSSLSRNESRSEVIRAEKRVYSAQQANAALAGYRWFVRTYGTRSEVSEANFIDGIKVSNRGLALSGQDIQNALELLLEAGIFRVAFISNSGEAHYTLADETLPGTSRSLWYVANEPTEADTAVLEKIVRGFAGRQAQGLDFDLRRLVEQAKQGLFNAAPTDFFASRRLTVQGLNSAEAATGHIKFKQQNARRGDFAVVIENPPLTASKRGFLLEDMAAGLLATMGQLPEVKGRFTVERNQNVLSFRRSEMRTTPEEAISSILSVSMLKLQSIADGKSANLSDLDEAESILAFAEQQMGRKTTRGNLTRLIFEFLRSIIQGSPDFARAQAAVTNMEAIVQGSEFDRMILEPMKRILTQLGAPVDQTAAAGNRPASLGGAGYEAPMRQVLEEVERLTSQPISTRADLIAKLRLEIDTLDRAKGRATARGNMIYSLLNFLAARNSRDQNGKRKAIEDFQLEAAKVLKADAVQKILAAIGQVLVNDAFRESLEMVMSGDYLVSSVHHKRMSEVYAELQIGEGYLGRSTQRGNLARALFDFMEVLSDPQSTDVEVDEAYQGTQDAQAGDFQLPSGMNRFIHAMYDAKKNPGPYADLRLNLAVQLSLRLLAASEPEKIAATYQVIDDLRNELQFMEQRLGRASTRAAFSRSILNFLAAQLSEFPQTRNDLTNLALRQFEEATQVTDSLPANDPRVLMRRWMQQVAGLTQPNQVKEEVPPGTLELLVRKVIDRIQRNQPTQILFLCTANKNRSPAMELLFRERLKDKTNVRIKSAGLLSNQIGIAGKPLGRMNQPLALAAKDYGITPRFVDEFRSTQFDPIMVRDATVIIVASRSHADFLEQNVPGALGKVVVASSLSPELGVRSHGENLPDPENGEIGMNELLSLLDSTVVPVLLSKMPLDFRNRAEVRSEERFEDGSALSPDVFTLAIGGLPSLRVQQVGAKKDGEERWIWSYKIFQSLPSDPKDGTFALDNEHLIGAFSETVRFNLGLLKKELGNFRREGKFTVMMNASGDPAIQEMRDKIASFLVRNSSRLFFRNESRRDAVDVDGSEVRIDGRVAQQEIEISDLFMRPTLRVTEKPELTAAWLADNSGLVIYEVNLVGNHKGWVVARKDLSAMDVLNAFYINLGSIQTKEDLRKNFYEAIKNSTFYYKSTPFKSSATVKIQSNGIEGTAPAALPLKVQMLQGSEVTLEARAVPGNPTVVDLIVSNGKDQNHLLRRLQWGEKITLGRRSANDIPITKEWAQISEESWKEFSKHHLVLELSPEGLSLSSSATNKPLFLNMNPDINGLEAAINQAVLEATGNQPVNLNVKYFAEPGHIHPDYGAGGNFNPKGSLNHGKSVVETIRGRAKAKPEEYDFDQDRFQITVEPGKVTINRIKTERSEMRRQEASLNGASKSEVMVFLRAKNSLLKPIQAEGQSRMGYSENGVDLPLRIEAYSTLDRPKAILTLKPEENLADKIQQEYLSTLEDSTLFDVFIYPSQVSNEMTLSIQPVSVSQAMAGLGWTESITRDRSIYPASQADKVAERMVLGRLRENPWIQNYPGFNLDAQIKAVRQKIYPTTESRPAVATELVRAESRKSIDRFFDQFEKVQKEITKYPIQNIFAFAVIIVGALGLFPAMALEVGMFKIGFIIVLILAIPFAAIYWVVSVLVPSIQAVKDQSRASLTPESGERSETRMMPPEPDFQPGTQNGNYWRRNLLGFVSGFGSVATYSKRLVRNFLSLAGHQLVYAEHLLTGASDVSGTPIWKRVFLIPISVIGSAVLTVLVLPAVAIALLFQSAFIFMKTVFGETDEFERSLIKSHLVDLYQVPGRARTFGIPDRTDLKILFYEFRLHGAIVAAHDYLFSPRENNWLKPNRMPQVWNFHGEKVQLRNLLLSRSEDPAGNPFRNGPTLLHHDEESRSEVRLIESEEDKLPDDGQLSIRSNFAMIGQPVLSEVEPLIVDFPEDVTFTVPVETSVPKPASEVSSRKPIATSRRGFLGGLSLAALGTAFFGVPGRSSAAETPASATSQLQQAFHILNSVEFNVRRNPPRFEVWRKQESFNAVLKPIARIASFVDFWKKATAKDSVIGSSPQALSLTHRKFFNEIAAMIGSQVKLPEGYGLDYVKAVSEILYRDIPGFFAKQGFVFEMMKVGVRYQSMQGGEFFFPSFEMPDKYYLVAEPDALKNLEGADRVGNGRIQVALVQTATLKFQNGQVEIRGIKEELKEGSNEMGFTLGATAFLRADLIEANFARDLEILQSGELSIFSNDLALSKIIEGVKVEVEKDGGGTQIKVLAYPIRDEKSAAGYAAMKLRVKVIAQGEKANTKLLRDSHAIETAAHEVRHVKDANGEYSDEMQAKNWRVVWQVGQSEANPKVGREDFDRSEVLLEQSARLDSLLKSPESYLMGLLATAQTGKTGENYDKANEEILEAAIQEIEAHPSIYGIEIDKNGLKLNAMLSAEEKAAGTTSVTLNARSQILAQFYRIAEKQERVQALHDAVRKSIKLDAQAEALAQKYAFLDPARSEIRAKLSSQETLQASHLLDILNPSGNLADFEVLNQLEHVESSPRERNQILRDKFGLNDTVMKSLGLGFTITAITGIAAALISGWSWVLAGAFVGVMALALLTGIFFLYRYDLRKATSIFETESILLRQMLKSSQELSAVDIDRFIEMYRSQFPKGLDIARITNEGPDTAIFFDGGSRQSGGYAHLTHPISLRFDPAQGGIYASDFNERLRRIYEIFVNSGGLKMDSFFTKQIATEIPFRRGSIPILNVVKRLREVWQAMVQEFSAEDRAQLIQILENPRNADPAQIRIITQALEAHDQTIGASQEQERWDMQPLNFDLNEGLNFLGVGVYLKPAEMLGSLRSVSEGRRSEDRSEELAQGFREAVITLIADEITHFIKNPSGGFFFSAESKERLEENAQRLQLQAPKKPDSSMEESRFRDLIESLIDRQMPITEFKSYSDKLESIQINSVKTFLDAVTPLLRGRLSTIFLAGFKDGEDALQTVVTACLEVIMKDFPLVKGISHYSGRSPGSRAEAFAVPRLLRSLPSHAALRAEMRMTAAEMRKDETGLETEYPLGVSETRYLLGADGQPLKFGDAFVNISITGSPESGYQIAFFTDLKKPAFKSINLNFGNAVEIPELGINLSVIRDRGFGDFRPGWVKLLVTRSEDRSVKTLSRDFSAEIANSRMSDPDTAGLVNELAAILENLRLEDPLSRNGFLSPRVVKVATWRATGLSENLAVMVSGKVDPLRMVQTITIQVNSQDAAKLQKLEGIWFMMNRENGTPVAPTDSYAAIDFFGQVNHGQTVISDVPLEDGLKVRVWGQAPQHPKYTDPVGLDTRFRDPFKKDIYPRSESRVDGESLSSLSSRVRRFSSDILNRELSLLMMHRFLEWGNQRGNQREFNRQWEALQRLGDTTAQQREGMQLIKSMEAALVQGYEFSGDIEDLTVSTPVKFILTSQEYLDFKRLQNLVQEKASTLTQFRNKSLAAQYQAAFEEMLNEMQDWQSQKGNLSFLNWYEDQSSLVGRDDRLPEATERDVYARSEVRKNVFGKEGDAEHFTGASAVKKLMEILSAQPGHRISVEVHRDLGVNHIEMGLQGNQLVSYVTDFVSVNGGVEEKVSVPAELPPQPFEIGDKDILQVNSDETLIFVPAVSQTQKPVEPRREVRSQDGKVESRTFSQDWTVGDRATGLINMDPTITGRISSIVDGRAEMEIAVEWQKNPIKRWVSLGAWEDVYLGSDRTIKVQITHKEQSATASRPVMKVEWQLPLLRRAEERVLSNESLVRAEFRQMAGAIVAAALGEKPLLASEAPQAVKEIREMGVGEAAQALREILGERIKLEETVRDQIRNQMVRTLEDSTIAKDAKADIGLVLGEGTQSTFLDRFSKSVGRFLARVQSIQLFGNARGRMSGKFGDSVRVQARRTQDLESGRLNLLDQSALPTVIPSDASAASLGESILPITGDLTGVTDPLVLEDVILLQTVISIHSALLIRANPSLAKDQSALRAELLKVLTIEGLDLSQIVQNAKFGNRMGISVNATLFRLQLQAAAQKAAGQSA